MQLSKWFEQALQARSTTPLEHGALKKWLYTHTGKHLRLDDFISMRVQSTHTANNEELAWVQKQKRSTQSTVVFVNGVFIEALSVLPEAVQVQACVFPEEEERKIPCQNSDTDLLAHMQSCGIDTDAIGHHKPSMADLIFAMVAQNAQKKYEIQLHKDCNLQIYRFYVSGSSAFTTEPIRMVCAAGVKAKVTEHLHCRGAHVVIQKKHVELHKESQLHYTYLDLHDHGRVLRTHSAVLMEDSDYAVQHIVAKGQLNMQSKSILLRAQGARYRFEGLSMAANDAQYHTDLTVYHGAQHTYSAQLHKSVVLEKASSGYQGKIYVAKGADKIQAAQQNHHLILDKFAKSYSKPELEIYADDVVCQHGSTVGVLSADLLFYIMSRGLRKSEAKSLCIQSFAAEVLEDVAQDLRKEVLQILVEYTEKKHA